MVNQIGTVIMKRNLTIITALILIITIFTSCERNKNIYQKYNESFFDTFDSLTQVVGYAKSEEEFKLYMDKIHSRFLELHKLFNIYNDYEGINNIKTINDNAGIKPVKVEKEIIDLILFSKEWYLRTGGSTNIAMGPVLEIWHDYREQGLDDPLNAKLPPMNKLIEASKYTDINKVIIDIQNSTIYLEEKQMSLDVGAVAKGFATEIVAKEIMADGFVSGIISPGGNVRVLNKPLDGIRENWGISIQNPDKFLSVEGDNFLGNVYLNNAAVVSSGDYQRYYYVEDKAYHHLIDPKTLMPGDYFRSVNVIAADSGIADFLSTSIFLMPYEQGKKLIEGLDNVEALWVMKDGKVEMTEGMKKIFKENLN